MRSTAITLRQQQRYPDRAAAAAHIQNLRGRSSTTIWWSTTIRRTSRWRGHGAHRAAGDGILLIGSDNNEVFNNTITGNKTAGVAVFSLTGTGAFNENELDVGPLAEGNYVHNNIFSDNGFDPDPVVAELGIPAGDILGYDRRGQSLQRERGDELPAAAARRRLA